MTPGRHRRGPTAGEQALRAAAVGSVAALAWALLDPFTPPAVTAATIAAPVGDALALSPAPTALASATPVVEVADAAPVSTLTAPPPTTRPTTPPAAPVVSTTRTAPRTTAATPTTTTRRPVPTTTVPPAPAPAAAPAARSAGAACSSELSGTVAHVARAGRSIMAATGFGGTVGGVGGRSRTSDHPSGHALDFMTSDRGTGDRIAAYALDHAEELGVSYVIWYQRYNGGGGWEPMADRGSPTENHYDHVHISFERTAPAEEPTC